LKPRVNVQNSSWTEISKEMLVTASQVPAWPAVAADPVSTSSMAVK
jgi:hypothetical protein